MSDELKQILKAAAELETEIIKIQNEKTRLLLSLIPKSDEPRPIVTIPIKLGLK